MLSSFGSITLTIAVPQQQEAEVALPLEQQVEAMLTPTRDSRLRIT